MQICKGEEKYVCDAEGYRWVRRSDTKKVEKILGEMNPNQLQELLMWAEESRTGLDCCLDNKDQECILAISEHVMAIENMDEPTLLSTVFPYTACVTSENMTKKILEKCPNYTNELLQAVTHQRKQNALHIACIGDHDEVVSTLLTSLKKGHNDIMQIQDEYGRTALHWTCIKGHKAMVKALLDAMKIYDKMVTAEMLLMQDWQERTVLHLASSEGHSDIVLFLLASLEDFGEDVMREGLQKIIQMPDDGGQTAFDLAQRGGYTKVLSSLLDAGLMTLQNYSLQNVKKALMLQNDNTESWKFVLSGILNKIKEIENDKKRLQWRVGQENGDDEQRAKLERTKKKLEEPYKLVLKYLPKIAAEKKKFGKSFYHNEDLNSLHIEMLDMCQKYYMNEKWNSKLSKMFCTLCIKLELDTTLDNNNEENQNDAINEENQNDEKKAKKKKYNQILPYSKVAPLHPLTVIGESGNLAIIKHPYIRTLVDAYWSYFARYIFGINLVLYVLFMFFMITFFTTYRVKSDGGVIEFSSNIPVLTEVSRYGAIVLALFGLIFEGMQIKTKTTYYFRQIENVADLILFLCTLVVMVITQILSYDEPVHWFGCILIVIAGIRAAWMFTHVYTLGIGHGFRMLFSVLLKVARFSPILLFFIVIFSIIFHNLLQNQEPFSHVGFSIMKIMAMSIGELDFADSFFEESNIHAFEIVAFLICGLFLAIMTISMMNLLIGIAVGNVGKLYKKGELEDFKSKDELILQYSCMMPGISRKIHAMSLGQIYKWGSRQNEKDDNNKFQEYLCNMEKEHIIYRVSTDTISAVEEKMDKTAKQTDIDELKKQMAKLRDDVNDLTKQMKKQMQRQMEKQSAKIDQLISHLNSKT